MTEMTHGIETPLPSRATRTVDRIWPGLVVVVGLAATVAWLCLLSYAFFSLVDLTF